MNFKEDYAKYADIIDLPHHQSAKRPHMPLEDRAAQFSPFAALTGYEDAVKETARLTDERIEMDEYSKEALNRQLNALQKVLAGNRQVVNGVVPRVKITYFVADARKAGGAYVTVEGELHKIKEYEQLLELTDGTTIPIADMIYIEYV